MSTHPIGSGTCNVAVNMLAEERLVLGRLAFRRGISTGELIRRLIDHAIQAEDLASARALQRVRSARQQIKAGLLLVLFCLGILTDRDLARPLRPARARRNEDHLVEVFA
jgi:hypothetical protein